MLCFCPDKQHFFETFMCLDLVLERLQSFLFQMFSSPSQALRERKQPEKTKERRPGRPSTTHQVCLRFSLTLLEPDGFTDHAAIHSAQRILYGVEGDNAITILDHAVLILHIQSGDRCLKDTKPSAMNVEASSSPAGCIVQGRVPRL